MSNKKKFTIMALICIMMVVLSMGIGSVRLSLGDMFKVMLHKLFHIEFSVSASELSETIFWDIRLPRTFLAFIAGSALAVSGVIMQSVLRNPLASTYTLGVSSGAAVGASVAIVTGITLFGMYTVSIAALLFGILSVFLAVSIAASLDRNMGNSTIILTGMALSLFTNSIITILLVFAKEDTQKLIFWQMGSFALKNWSHVLILFPVILTGIILSSLFSRKLDIMTFGEEQAKITGIEVVSTKWILLSISALLTAFTVSISGIIGFVDLFTPHIARRLFGSKHSYVIPASAMLGGLFMVLCDLLSRTVVSPKELPIGAVTSAIGAPFFMYLYYSRRKGRG